MTYIKIKDVSKTYNKSHVPVCALDRINLEIAQGEFVAVVGKSGSGKTTLLNCLGGLDQPDSGSIYIGNVDITRLKEKELCLFRRRNIGFVFQFFNLIEELTVFENIVYTSLLEKRSYDKAYIRALVEKLDLKERLDHLPSELSGGQQQRTAIARAFSLKPSVVLLDEPTGNLDRQSSENVTEMILKLHQELNQTVLMITHDKEIAAKADRQIVLSDGKTVDVEG